jgi:guanylate kinase
MGEVSLYGIVAPYSSGKDSVVNELITKWPDLFAVIVGDTSRPPRQNEINGVTYHFRQLDEMIADLRAGRFVQVVPGFEGNFYATRPEQYPTGKIAVKPIQAREMLNYQKLNLKELKWLQIVPYSNEAWLLWRARRTFSPQDRAERDQEAIQSYELAFANPDTIYILNDTVENAAQRVLQVANGQIPADADKAKAAANEIYSHLTGRH